MENKTERQIRIGKLVRDLAKKYGVSEETVVGIFSEFSNEPLRSQIRKTKQFFELYFEGRNSNG